METLNSNLLIPSRNLALPRVEFPRWIRGVGDALDAFFGMAGTLAPLGSARTAGAANWWEAGGATGCVAAYAPKGAASLAASYVNLANPGTYDCAPSGTAPILADGWVFPGTGNTMLVNGLTLTNNEWTVIGRVTIIGWGGGTAGRLVSSNSDKFFIIPNNGNQNIAFQNGNTTLWTTPSFVNGTKTLAIAGTSAYRDGVFDGLITNAALPAGNFGIGNRPADSARCLHGTIAALAIYNAVLTAPQVAVITMAMNAL